tara:strand:- start:161 stop:379 length:219 start_codon:yes stop_codon:yes gene_type:complete
MGFDYASVKRWTRKFDIFSYDLLLVPMHLNGNHWTFSVADLRVCGLELNDSLGVTAPNLSINLSVYIYRLIY